MTRGMSVQGSTLLWGNTGKVQLEEEENLIQIMYFPELSYFYKKRLQQNPRRFSDLDSWFSPSRPGLESGNGKLFSISF